MTGGFDQEALDDIEHQLRAEDAEFVDLFRLGRETAGRTPGRDWRRGFSTAIVLAIVLGVLFVVAGQPSVAVLCCLAAGALALLRVRYCAGRRFPGSGSS